MKKLYGIVVLGLVASGVGCGGDKDTSTGSSNNIPKTGIYGIVKDADGEPIESAIISLEVQDDPVSGYADFCTGYSCLFELVQQRNLPAGLQIERFITTPNGDGVNDLKSFTYNGENVNCDLFSLLNSDGETLGDLHPAYWSSEIKIASSDEVGAVLIEHYNEGNHWVTNLDERFTWRHSTDDGSQIELTVSLIIPPLSDSRGAYSLESLPSGTWPITAWGPQGKNEDKLVTYDGTGAMEVNFTLNY